MSLAATMKEFERLKKKIVPLKYVKNNINPDYKFHVIESPDNTGKTTTVINFLKTYPGKFICIACEESCATYLKSKYHSENLTTGDIKSEQGNLVIAPTMLSQVKGTYEIVVINECASILDHFPDDEEGSENLDKLMSLVINASHVLCTDVEMTNRIFCFLNIMDETQMIQYHQNIESVESKTSRFSTSKAEMVSLIKKCTKNMLILLNGKSTFIQNVLHNLGIKAEEGGYLMYEANEHNVLVPPEEVKAVWEKYKVIIYTTTTSCSRIRYTASHLDILFTFFNPEANLQEYTKIRRRFNIPIEYYVK